MAEGATKARNPFRRRSAQGASAHSKNDDPALEQLATRFLAELHSALKCKIACNDDPLRGDFRVQFRPL